MALILNIDTAVETASVCLSNDAEMINLSVNDSQKDHAAWLHPSIRKLIQETGRTVNDLQAVAISIGPGSYTGLRIGLSAAKGLCYALNIPLIAVGTLEMMAYAVKKEDAQLLCPLIDARRMEVFTAVYDKSLQEIMKPCAMIIDKNSFEDLLSSHKIIFCGNGRKKLQSILCHINAIFSNNIATAANLSYLARKKFQEGKFSDPAYTEPLYLKEFYSPPR
jgi:tRNA threonylcarbamoyladenosine biosynthesis protein TsaB